MYVNPGIADCDLNIKFGNGLNSPRPKLCYERTYIT